MQSKQKVEPDGVVSEALLEHIKVLASDELQGRAPGTAGEERTKEYLAECCRQIGLESAGDDGSYFQKMPVVGVVGKPEIVFESGSGKFCPDFPDAFVGQSKHLEKLVSGDETSVVFAGYGIEAPEYGWNDFDGVDVRGKTVVVLIGQPERPDAEEPGKLDESFFKGRALTYYGRWTYKYEKASEMGAAAVLIVHDDRKAGYGYDVVRSSWTGENYQLTCPDERVLLEGWLSYDSAVKLFEMSSLDFDRLKEEAGRPGFKARTLEAKCSFKVQNEIRRFESSNVIAKIEGQDPTLKDETIVYSAHWDHFGIKEKDGRVDVYSGAVDNGSGVAMTLEIARRFKNLKKAPSRTILFLFTTLEESGLLGAEHYVKEPAMPIESTIAIINMDVMNVWGRTEEIVSIATGHSSLDQLLSDCAASQDRRVVPDPEPEKGYFFRSDHLAFLQKGIPALFFLFPGSCFRDKPSDFGRRIRTDYIVNDYHKPSDKVKDDWDLSGAAEDVELLFSVGEILSEGENKPSWNPQSEFADSK